MLSEMEGRRHVIAANKRRRVPKGTSGYQAAWMSGSDDEGSDEKMDPENSEDYEDVDVDIKPVKSKRAGKKANDDESSEDGDVVEHDECQNDDVDSQDTDDYEMLSENEDYQSDIFPGHLSSQLKGHSSADRAQQYKDDTEFPDEMDTPLEVPARVRFQRYRGIESIRSTPWDPYENLPADYGKIFQFEDYKRTNKIIMSEQGPVPVGARVTIYVRNVDPEALTKLSVARPMVIWGLHKYEHRMTLLTVVLTRPTESEQDAGIIKSKVWSCTSL